MTISALIFDFFIPMQINTPGFVPVYTPYFYLYQRQVWPIGLTGPYRRTTSGLNSAKAYLTSVSKYFHAGITLITNPFSLITSSSSSVIINPSDNLCSCMASSNPLNSLLRVSGSSNDWQT